MRSHYSWLTAAALLCGCADFGGPVGNEQPLSPEERRMQALETRLADVTRKLENLNLAAQNQSLTRLEGELRSLRGEVEQLRHDIGGTEKRGRDLYQDLDRRLQKIEHESRPARLSMSPSISNAPPPPPSQEEEAAYLRAFEQLKSGQYDAAIAAFREMQARWPQGRYADNAWYWMGESHYVKREYEPALEAFRSLLNQFPASPKVPDAMLKIGLAQIELKRPDDARGILEKLVAEHGNSNAARLARQRLEQLPPASQ